MIGKLLSTRPVQFFAGLDTGDGPPNSARILAAFSD